MQLDDGVLKALGCLNWAIVRASQNRAAPQRWNLTSTAPSKCDRSGIWSCFGGLRSFRSESRYSRRLGGRRRADRHTLFRPKLCMHHRGYPNEEGTNETFAYDWLRARRCVLREPGECRRTHGDIEEH